MRQRFENSGTFLNEATRILILIVAVDRRAVEEWRTAAAGLRLAQARADDLYDPELRAARARYQRLWAIVAAESVKAREEERATRLKVAGFVFMGAIALALFAVAAAVLALPVPLQWLDRADFVAGVAGLALAGTVALALFASPRKMLDALLFAGLQGGVVVSEAFLRLRDRTFRRPGPGDT